MRFLQKDKNSKILLVISDLHLGAGAVVNGKRNCLEEFHFDKELVDFLDYYSTGEYASREVELALNGDIFDLLAVPYVTYFDDEFWSEEASLEKLKLIVAAHREVIEALGRFLQAKKTKVVYILGNHDAELVLESLQTFLLEQFPEKGRENFQMIVDGRGEYSPSGGVILYHGHQHEMASNFNSCRAVICDESDKKYFLPPWGSYYVTRVLNKFKEERDYIGSVRPIRKFIINGLIYDTLFTFRFMLASCWYFLMVRFIYFFKQGKNLKTIFEHIKGELELFKDYETMTKDFLQARSEVKVLVLAHTHIPIMRSFSDGITVLNTGSWTKMHNMDIGKRGQGSFLTYAQIEVSSDEKDLNKDNCYDASLNVWKGLNRQPYYEFN